MKRKTTIAIICILAALLLAAPISYAWFNESLRTEAHMNSFVHKSYFESGDGTGIFQFNESYTTDESGRETAVHGVDGDGNTLTSEEGCAFEIKYPVQLYYFAWLQYLGYFNQPTEDGSAISQVYFYLSADLDMTGWVLPPVGTQQYPFVGNFDGNGHVISNLTVQNVVTGHDAAPGTLNDIPVENFSGAEIVGFFGVVGSLEAGGTVNAASDNGSGSFVVAPGYTYDTAINTLHDFALANVTVKTETSRSLIGIVAGYLNADISNVRVGENGTIIRTGTVAALDTANLTGNLSDHALIGYTLNKDTSDVVFAEIDTPAEHNSKFNYMSQGASAGFGGSIDMLDMYNRLGNVHGTNFGNMTNITATNHVATETRRYNADGVMIGDPVRTNGAPEDTFYYRYTAANDGSGQYVLSAQNGIGRTEYYYLAGTYKTVFEIHETNDTVQAFYIQHNGTYLNLNNNHNGVIATTPTGGNTKWVIDANNHIYTQDNDGNKYYLNANNNSLQIDNTGTTAWTKTADAIRNGNNGPYLQYDNGWKLLADGSTTYYYISYVANNTTYYLNESNGTIQRGTSATSKWYRSGNNSGTLHTESANGNTYYLYTNGSNGNLSLQTGNSTTWTFNSNGEIYHSSGFYTYYICIRNNAWTCRRNTTPHGIIAQGGTDTQTHTALTFTDTTVPVINRVEISEPSDICYLPLGATTTSPYTVSESNTGYIIGGSHETTSERKSDIRVSQYGKSNITSGLTNTNNNGQVNNSNVRTVDANGIHTIGNTGTYARYADAVKQFNTVLNGTTNVYGLHFMNAEINTDNLIVAPTVKLEGTTYTNYQMPEDSIDFLVHQTGYITFFAGTYFTNNNSFFSLHTIERYKEDDADVIAGRAKVKDIKSIKEIKEIWKSSDQSKDHIYYLKKEDGSYEWTGTRTSDYSLAFNTDWITQPGTTNQLGNTNLYYFEIPVDAGEYALGSVEGRIGAYLLYLDIAANAQLVKRTAVTEVFEETTKTYEFPVGVTFRNTAIPETAENTVLEPSALAAMGTGDASVSATVASDTDITVTGGSVTYIEDGVTVNGQTNSDLAVAPVAETTTYIRRTTYFDYNVAKNVYTVTQVVVKKVDNAAPLLIINAWNTGSDWDITSGEATQIATMEEGVAFNTGSNTASVPINSGVATTLGYTEVDEVYCYLINVGTEENAQTLRIETPALEGGFTITDLLYEFSYGIKDNDAADGGATIEYDYKSDIDFNNNVEQVESMFAHSNRRYAVTVSTASTVNTKVITGVTDANFTVALTPAPQ